MFLSYFYFKKEFLFEPGMTSGLTKKLIQDTITKSPEGR
jgi:hypothetical protein